MLKYLLLIALVLVVLGALRKARGVRASRNPPAATRAPEAMVKCAYCGVNQPISESILTHGNYYCCNDHRRLAESADAR